MARFELVSRFANDPSCAYALPKRATAHAAGYDLYAAEDVLIRPYFAQMVKWCETDPEVQEQTETEYPVRSLSEVAKFTKENKIKPTLVSTGMKIKLDDNEYLELLPRSSTPLKYWLVLANSSGIIDSDYYNNPDNEGEIFLQLINLSPVTIQIHKGDFLGQGIIHKYYTTEDDCAEGQRQGGFGSTH